MQEARQESAQQVDDLTQRLQEEKSRSDEMEATVDILQGRLRGTEHELSLLEEQVRNNYKTITMTKLYGTTTITILLQ